MNIPRFSVIPIVLEPLSSDHADAMGCLAHLAELDMGCVLQVHGKEVFLFSFPVCFLDGNNNCALAIKQRSRVEDV